MHRPGDQASISVDRQIPKVSVLICVYNDEEFVGLAIASILAQTYQDFELVIVDDGSTDGTAEILARYARQDGRIRIFSQANAGTTVAANFGLSKCRGVYIARLDSDDISLPHRLEVEVNFLNNHPDIALVGGGVEVIDVQGRVLGARNIRAASPKRALRHRCIYQQTDVMFRKDVVLSLGGYREKFHNAQDYDLWLRMSEVAGIAKLMDVLGQWRMRGGGYTLSRMEEQAQEVRTIKRFAAQRRSTGSDGYASFIPPKPAAHRESFAAWQYDLWAGSILLQALRPKEARAKIRSCLNADKSVYVSVLYWLTFLPKPVLSLIFSARNLYLNNFN